jgi:hypothetical protein
MRTVAVFLLLAAPQAVDPPIGKSPLLLQETFELTAPGDTPKGFQKTGAVSVVEGGAFSGKRCLQIEAAANGPRRITMKGDILKQLGGQHWGRLYFKVKLPHPEPANGVIHSTLVAGSAKSPIDQQEIEVRPLDTVLGKDQKHQWIYNVQPRSRPEFGKGGGYGNKYPGEWTLAEWYLDYATQSYRLFINGEEIKDIAFSKGKGNFKDAEIPEVFESLSFGWNNYQQAGAGFVAWIDDIALSKDRIGARGVIPTKKK